MKSKITVIGAGSVGATIAYTLSNEDIATEIVLIDINKQKAEGEVMDIIQGTCFRDPISIKSGDYEDAKDSNIVIITSGVARKPGQSRLELTQTNVDIIKSIAPNIAKAAPNALYIIVSNPVDIITYVFMKISGIPENQIIGSGTALDTARLRFGLASHFNIAQKNIHAYVFGEHGDSSFIPWSCAEVSGAKLDDYVELMHALPVDKDAMAEYVKHYPNGSFPVPSCYAHPIVLKRMIDAVEEGQAVTTAEALDAVKARLQAVNADVQVEQEEYDEIVAIKALFLNHDYQ